MASIGPERVCVPKVRKVVSGDVVALSASLARAYFDDPVSSYLFPDERHRLRRLERYFKFQFRTVFLPRDESWTTEELDGASLWMPPRDRPPTTREGLAQLPIVTILGRFTGRAIRLVDVLESNHPRAPHYYLGTIGTEPEHQRRGIGSALMSPVLDRCDESGEAAYLVSSKAENLPFYHRHGFEVVKQVGVPGVTLPLWLMWREPGAS